MSELLSIFWYLIGVLVGYWAVLCVDWLNERWWCRLMIFVPGINVLMCLVALVLWCLWVMWSVIKWVVYGHF